MGSSAKAAIGARDHVFFAEQFGECKSKRTRTFPTPPFFTGSVIVQRGGVRGVPSVNGPVAYSAKLGRYDIREKRAAINFARQSVPAHAGERGGPMIVPPDLIRAINRGRCFAIVGSGPSCEVGYPSWRQLATATYEALKASGKIDDHDSYRMYLEKNEYPELFGLAEYDIGGRDKLAELLTPLPVPRTAHKPEQIYDFLTQWPFAVYLTTNYDDEISTRLAELGSHYATVQNTVGDLGLLREGVSDLIVKLHSDLNHPHNAVITSKDYKNFSVDDAGNYFRARLRSVMETFDVLIIGHSLSDIDFQIVLQAAQQTGSPVHPIYMVATGFAPADERLFFEKYRICLIRYENSDGQHLQLKRLLSTHNRYIVSRSDTYDRPALSAASGADAEVASALFLYRKLAGSAAHDEGGDWYLRPLVINLLRESDKALSTAQIAGQQPFLSLAARNQVALHSQLEIAIAALRTEGLVAGNTSISLSSAGVERANGIAKAREVLKDQAFGQFVVTLKKSLPSLTGADEVTAIAVLQRILVDVFKKRGAAIANAIFADTEIGHDDLSDIFAAVYHGMQELKTPGAQIPFVDAVHEFLIHPSHTQEEYLAALSQGFFLHHLLGLDLDILVNDTEHYETAACEKDHQAVDAMFNRHP